LLTIGNRRRAEKKRLEKEVAGAAAMGTEGDDVEMRCEFALLG